MDRFIAPSVLSVSKITISFKIQYGQIYSELAITFFDNFRKFKIQYGQIYRMTKGTWCMSLLYLKSNMDRFIEFPLSSSTTGRKFKIQYGQIYSKLRKHNDFLFFLFKIQYGQIYSDTATEVNIKSMYLKSNMDRFIDLCSVFHTA